MKNIQISQELFLTLIRFHLLDESGCEEEIRRGLEKKLDALVLRDLYSKSKTAATEQEREEARKKYLDRKGITESFRW